MDNDTAWMSMYNVLYIRIDAFAIRWNWRNNNNKNILVKSKGGKKMLNFAKSHIMSSVMKTPVYFHDNWCQSSGFFSSFSLHHH